MTRVSTSTRKELAMLQENQDLGQHKIIDQASTSHKWLSSSRTQTLKIFFHPL